MSMMIDAIYDGEVLRPQGHLDLKPNAHYWITIEDQPASEQASSVVRTPSSSLDSQADVKSRAWDLYDRKFKALLEPQFNGQTIAIDLNSEDYEVASRSSQAWRPLKARRPDANLVLIKIGPVASDWLSSAFNPA